MIVRNFITKLVFSERGGLQLSKNTTFMLKFGSSIKWEPFWPVLAGNFAPEVVLEVKNLISKQTALKKPILVDPRKFCPPTPITDQDAKKLEQMLEENDTVADNSSPQFEKQPIVTESQTATLEKEATCEARTDIISMPLLESLFPDQNKSPVSDNTQAHQKMVDKTDIATQVSQPRKNFVVTREILFSNLTDNSLIEGFDTDINIDEEQDNWLKDLIQPRPADSSDPWADNNYQPQNRKIPLVTPVINNTPEASPRRAPSPLHLEIRDPRPYPENPAIPEYVHEEAKMGRIPPWEFHKSLRSVMKSIIHDNEQYLVLDDLADAEVHDDVNEMNYDEVED